MRITGKFPRLTGEKAAIAAKRGAPAAQAVEPQVQAVPLCGKAKRKQYCLYCFLFVGADNRTTDKASPFLAGGSVTLRPFLLKIVYQTVFRENIPYH